MRKKTTAKKLSVNWTKQEVEMLDYLQRIRNTTYTDIIKKAILREFFMERILEQEKKQNEQIEI